MNPIQRAFLAAAVLLAAPLVHAQANDLHIVKPINGPRCQIGNNRGLINGWIGTNGSFGKCIRFEADLLTRCPADSLTC